MYGGKEYTKRILKHYFGLAGVMVDSDNHAEIDAAVDALFEAAVEEAVRRIMEPTA